MFRNAGVWVSSVAPSVKTQIQFLDSVLAERTDPITHKKFSTEWAGKSIFDFFWDKVWSYLFAGKLKVALVLCE